MSTAFDPTSQTAAEPIAIIGCSARLPGASDLDAFWDNLVACKSSVGPLPPARTEHPKLANAGFLDDVTGFDAGFFAITEEEARLMDPVQRLSLETAWHCVEEAGWRPSDLARSETGVFVATGKSDYEEHIHRAGITPTGFLPTGVASAIIANRISFALGLTGPSITLDTACSGSLTALHLAAQALRNGDCSTALVGGANVILSDTLTEGLAHEGTVSPDFQTRSFDATANGYARGEGVIFLLLKPLRAAEADGDHIHGLLLASAISHGGRANWLTAPNAIAQQNLVTKAWQRACVPPYTITYVEAHGTGTSLGDAIEFNAIRKADDALLVGETSAQHPSCLVGSVKPNVGHLEAASGLAGVLKVLLSMKHGKIPGNPYLTTPNPLCKIAGGRLRLAHRTQDWPRVTDETGSPLARRAGVSAFGFGGAYGHVVLEEPPAPPAGPGRDHILPVLPVSANSEAELTHYVRSLADFAQRQSCPARKEEPGTAVGKTVLLEDFLFTFQVGRIALPRRAAFLGKTWTSLHEVLRQWLDGREDTRIISPDVDTPSDDELERLAIAFAQQWVAGQKRDFSTLYDGRGAGRVSAPVYPFSRSRYWFSEGEATSSDHQREEMDVAPSESGIHFTAGDR